MSMAHISKCFYSKNTRLSIKFQIELTRRLHPPSVEFIRSLVHLNRNFFSLPVKFYSTSMFLFGRSPFFSQFTIGENWKRNHTEVLKDFRRIPLFPRKKGQSHSPSFMQGIKHQKNQQVDITIVRMFFGQNHVLTWNECC